MYIAADELDAIRKQSAARNAAVARTSKCFSRKTTTPGAPNSTEITRQSVQSLAHGDGKENNNHRRTDAPSPPPPPLLHEECPNAKRPRLGSARAKS